MNNQFELIKELYKEGEFVYIKNKNKILFYMNKPTYILFIYNNYFNNNLKQKPK